MNIEERNTLHILKQFLGINKVLKMWSIKSKKYKINLDKNKNTKKILKTSELRIETKPMKTNMK